MSWQRANTQAAVNQSDRRLVNLGAPGGVERRGTDRRAGRDRRGRS